MGWLIFLAVVILVAFIPLGVQIQYNSDGFLAKIYALWFHFTVFPFPTRKRVKNNQAEHPSDFQAKDPQPSDQQIKTQKNEPPQKNSEKSGGKLTDFMPLIKIGLDLVNDFRKKIRVNTLQFRLILGGDDPCDLAVNYGRAWAAAENILLLLDRIFVIGKKDVEVECDFTSNETKVNIFLDISITFGRMIMLGSVYGVKALAEFLKIRNINKAVRKNESKSS